MSNLCIAVKTAEDKLEPTAQANSVATAMKLALLTKQAEQGLGFNTREVIEESKEWPAPVTGTYWFYLINGGNGCYINPITIIGSGGSSGTHYHFLIFLEKGTPVNITIGAGGLGSHTNADPAAVKGGGTFITIDGEDIYPDDLVSTVWEPFQINNSSSNYCDFHGNGPNSVRCYGLTGNTNGHLAGYDATRFGGGGAGRASKISGDTVYYYGNGAQGCAIVEYFDPAKASLPTINDTDLIPYVNLLQRLEAIEAQLNINS